MDEWPSTTTGVTLFSPPSKIPGERLAGRVCLSFSVRGVFRPFLGVGRRRGRARHSHLSGDSSLFHNLCLNCHHSPRRLPPAFASATSLCGEAVDQSALRCSVHLTAISPAQANRGGGKDFAGPWCEWDSHDANLSVARCRGLRGFDAPL